MVLRRGNRSCYVIFRKDRPKNLPLFASIVYVSDRTLFRYMFRPFTRHLLLHHGLPATLIELRVAEYRPWPSVNLGTPRRKMILSSRLRPDDIDYLYSELVCVPF